MSDYVLHAGGFSRGLICEMVLAELGLAYELVQVDILSDEHKEAAFLKFNPAGLVPVLVCPGGEKIHQTHGINLYLSETHGDGLLAPESKDKTRKVFLSTLMYLSSELEPAMKRYFYPFRYAVRKEDEGEIKIRAIQSINKSFEFLNQQISQCGPYLLGTRFSFLDITLAYWYEYFDPNYRSNHVSALDDCVNKVVTRPALNKHFSALKRMRIDYAALQAKDSGAR